MLPGQAYLVSEKKVFYRLWLRARILWLYSALDMNFDGPIALRTI